MYITVFVGFIETVEGTQTIFLSVDFEIGQLCFMLNITIYRIDVYLTNKHNISRGDPAWSFFFSFEISSSRASAPASWTSIATTSDPSSGTPCKGPLGDAEMGIEW